MPRRPVEMAISGCSGARMLRLLLNGSEVNRSPPSPRPFLEVRILKDFKSNDFGSADSKRVTRVFFVSADSEGLAELAPDEALKAETRGNERRK